MEYEVIEEAKFSAYNSAGLPTGAERLKPGEIRTWPKTYGDRLVSAGLVKELGAIKRVARSIMPPKPAAPSKPVKEEEGDDGGEGSPDPADMTAKEVKSWLENASPTIAQVQSMRDAERVGHSRTAVLETLQKYLSSRGVNE